MPEAMHESLTGGARDYDAPGGGNTVNSSSLGEASTEPSETSNASDDTTTTRASQAKRDWRSWAPLVSINLAESLTALEGTMTSTALPSIVDELGGGRLCIWIVNGYLFAIPCSDSWPTSSAAHFVLGSGVCAGANNVGTLIAGRVIQGIGASGTTVLTETINCGVVPLRERGKFLAIVMGMIFQGAALGSLFAGLTVQYSSWRWTLYLVLPVGGAALSALFFFLNVGYQKETNLATRISTIDWTGNVIFIASITSVLIGLSWAGVLHPWELAC
ncbi:major facilitator superfamily domain-containing protein [Colletotrichum navitas]|uniref:Major facilitator superfamily domain-containing protein n=1 Tax=Colletotrichum navitas TaxID=681940 RepID=A0AAD8Q1E6_9PEZI|nr:major facilitator superfamily domain-containing protein [Colletotrichum navitas]KAK1593144.1 major facilitator superfamily domain-containing protein [Colletotrichum navitas]